MLPNPDPPIPRIQPADRETPRSAKADLTCSACGTQLAGRVHGRMAHLVAASLCPACSRAEHGRYVRVG